jgi:hypothetical protein
MLSAPAGEASGLSLISVNRGVVVDTASGLSLVAGVLCPTGELDKTLRTLPRCAGFLMGVACVVLVLLLKPGSSAAERQLWFRNLCNLRMELIQGTNAPLRDTKHQG